jgi:hypothetical protein
MVLVEQRSPKLKEVLRAKEEFLKACVAKNPMDQQGLDRYFMQFAIAARLNR